MKSAFSRRRLLRLCGAGICGGIAGCSSLATKNEMVTFCHLELMNEDQNPHRIHLQIEADDSVILDDTYDLPSATGDSPREVVAEREFDPRDWFDGTARRLTLTGRVDDQESVGPIDLTASELGETAEIIYHIQDDGTLEINYLAAGDGSCSSPSSV